MKLPICSSRALIAKNEQHATPATLRKEIVQRFAQDERIEPSSIELPEQPAQAIKELGKPLGGLCCKTCRFLTVNTNVMRMHLKREHQQAWKGKKSALYESVKVQTFFNGGGLQKYFVVDLDENENGEKSDQSPSTTQRVARSTKKLAGLRGLGG
jgi:hypothetical protein